MCSSPTNVYHKGSATMSAVKRSPEIRKGYELPHKTEL